MNVIETINKAASTDFEAMRNAFKAAIQQDTDFAQGKTGKTLQSIEAHKSALFLAWAYIENGMTEHLGHHTNMGEGVVALGIACKLLGIPAHERTAIALRTWPE